MRLLLALAFFAWAQSVVAATFVGEIQGSFRVTERIDNTTTVVSTNAPLGISLSTDYTTMRWSIDLDGDILMAGGPSQSFETRLMVTGNLISRRCVAPCSLAGLGDPSPLSFPNASGQSGAGDVVLVGSADWTLTDRIVTAVRERHGPETEIMASGYEGGDNAAQNPGSHYLSVFNYPSHIQLSPILRSDTAWRVGGGQWMRDSGYVINLGRIIDGNNYLEVAVTPQFPSNIMLHEVLPGDFSGNGSVDAADYPIWRKSPGLAAFLTDFDLWRSNFGNELGSGSGGGASSSVPEPTSAALGLMVAMTLVALHRVGWPPRI
jgi:hypothetical protein